MPSASQSRRRSQTVLTAAALASLGLLPTFSRAADIHWIAADGDWNVATNWAPAPPEVTPTVPDADDRALVDRVGGGIAHVTSDVPDVLGVSVSNANHVSVEANGILNTLGSDPNDGPNNGIHIADGGNGTATVAGNGRLATAQGGYGAVITVGRGGGTGVLTVNGDAPTDVSPANVDANDLHVGGTELPGGGGGSAGTGTLNLNSGKINTRAWAFVGRDGGTGTLNQAGGVNAIGGQLNIGFNGGNGTYNLSGGTTTIGNDYAVGAGGGSVGTVNQTGGSVSVSAWAFVSRGGGNATYNLSGASSAVNVNGSYIVGFEGNSNGVFNVSGGTLNITKAGGDAASGHLILGMDNASGTFNQTGGVVNSHWGFAGRAGTTNKGVGVFNHSGGTYSTKGWIRVGENPGSAGQYNLSGTAVVNIGGGDDDLGDDDLIVGVDPDGHGTFTVAGTSVANVARDLRLGQNGGFGNMVQDGGDVNVIAGAGFVGVSPFGANFGGVGQYDLNAGTLDVTLDMNVGQDAGATGTFNVAGGTATIGAAVVAGRSGAGTVNVSGGTLNAGSVIVQLNAGSTGDFNVSGGTVNALSTSNNGTFDASGTGVANLGPVGGTGAMTVADTAQVNAQHIRQASLNMTGGTATIAETETGTAAGVSVIPTYTLSGDARFDLKDNKLITQKAIGTHNGTEYDGVHGDVARAYNFGSWDQPGLTTSKPNAGQNAGVLSGTTTLGVGSAQAILFLENPTDTGVWAGQTVTGTDTIVMYTYAGDMNFDGLVDGADYGFIDDSVQFPGRDGYSNGDLNFDGVIDGADYGIIDNTIQLQGAPFDTTGAVALSGVTAVPEPAMLSVLGLSTLGLLSRRRRTR